MKFTLIALLILVNLIHVYADQVELARGQCRLGSVKCGPSLCCSTFTSTCKTSTNPAGELEYSCYPNDCAVKSKYEVGTACNTLNPTCGCAPPGTVPYYMCNPTNGVSGLGKCAQCTPTALYNCLYGQQCIDGRCTWVVTPSPNSITIGTLQPGVLIIPTKYPTPKP